MNQRLGQAALALVLAIGTFTAMSQTNNPALTSEAEVMRELRVKILNTPASQLGLKPTKDYPRVYTVLMDWPLDTNTVSVYGSCTGDASVYTTFTFGVFGGIGHETVRNAAQQFVKVAEKYHDEARITTDFPYPKPGHIYFYLVCHDGVRMIDAEDKYIQENLRNERAGKFIDLYNQGQRVIGELRLIVEKQKAEGGYTK